jgi:hypothetical protein
MQHNVKLGDVFKYIINSKPIYYRIQGVYDKPNVSSPSFHAVLCDENGVSVKVQKRFTLNTLGQLPGLEYICNVPSGRSKYNSNFTIKKKGKITNTRRLKYLMQKINQLTKEAEIISGN